MPLTLDTAQMHIELPICKVVVDSNPMTTFVYIHGEIARLMLQRSGYRFVCTEPEFPREKWVNPSHVAHLYIV